MKLKTIEGYKKPVFVRNNGIVLPYIRGIRNIRKNLGLNTKEFGEKIGVSGRTVEDYEQGRCEPSKAVLMLMKGLI